VPTHLIKHTEKVNTVLTGNKVDKLYIQVKILTESTRFDAPLSHNRGVFFNFTQSGFAFTFALCTDIGTISAVECGVCSVCTTISAGLFTVFLHQAVVDLERIANLLFNQITLFRHRCFLT
jgi:hypothetical protein